MKNLQLYSIFDAKVSAYQPPFTAQNDAHAKRMLADTAKDPKTLFHQHPADYTLFKIGSFDDETGQLVSLPHSRLESLGNVLSITVEALNGKTLAEELAALYPEEKR